MRDFYLLCVVLSVAFTGCFGAPYAPVAGYEAAPGEVGDNPLFVPHTDREFLWNQVVDSIDDHFRIEAEHRMRLVGGVLTEGRIDTFPTIGSTILEPWRRDSTRGYERWHSTLQSVRRRALVKVAPSQGGYLVYVQVLKEVEDLDRPEHATAGTPTFRHDGTLVQREDRVESGPVTLGWIPLGRDATLEQRILNELRGRLTNYGAQQQAPSAQSY